MPRVKRMEICAQDEVQAFPLINRCVRRTYLCGKDRKSGKDYSHRKQWIRDRLECSAETWLDFVQNFRKRFRMEAGLPHTGG